MDTEKIILLGVDGSKESLFAVDWAIAHAQKTNSMIHVLCAYSLPNFTPSSLDGGYATIDDTVIREGAKDVVEQVAKQVSEAGVKVTSSVEVGDPARILVELSKEVSMIVVGKSSAGGIADRLLGSVSSALPAYSECPVVIVPYVDGHRKCVPVKRMVVGLDGSQSSRPALHAAVDVAKCWGSELMAITAVPVSSGTGMLAWLPATVDRDSILHDVEESLNDLLDTEASDSGLDIARHALDGSAPALLAEFSTTMDMIVVGTRGLGGFKGLLLGSTSQTLLGHSLCPVMVVPSGSDQKSE